MINPAKPNKKQKEEVRKNAAGIVKKSKEFLLVTEQADGYHVSIDATGSLFYATLELIVKSLANAGVTRKHLSKELADYMDKAYGKQRNEYPTSPIGEA